MADFVQKDAAEAVSTSSECAAKAVEGVAAATVPSGPQIRNLPETMIDASKPLSVVYCGVCSMPPEFCEFGACYEQCRQWIESNCPDIINLATSVGNTNILDGTDSASVPAAKPRGSGAAAPKKLANLQTRILISRIQRQKKKFVTAVVGLDTIPDVKIKDIAKLFGKKFSSGASVGETATGAKEVTIQGDVSFDVPPLLIQEYRVCYLVIAL